jgi:signal peptidase II
VGRQHLAAAATVAAVVIADLVTKSWALRTLPGSELELLGGLVPLNLAFNQGAAFGLTIGDDPRLVFVPVTLLAVAFLAMLIVRAGPGDGLRTGSAALVLGGALGNLYDRVRWDRGVVDFIGPIDLGFMYWPIFNVADMAITVGAILLAIAFWREDRRAGEEGEAHREASPSAG